MQKYNNKNPNVGNHFLNEFIGKQNNIKYKTKNQWIRENAKLFTDVIEKTSLVQVTRNWFNNKAVPERKDILTIRLCYKMIENTGHIGGHCITGHTTISHQTVSLNQNKKDFFSVSFSHPLDTIQSHVSRKFVFFYFFWANEFIFRI